MSNPILLTDEQMREYIVNGYLVFEPSLPGDIHDSISRKLAAYLQETHNPGNNVLPVVPEMRHILNSPEVRGALISVLGNDYIEHPHRFCHSLAPVRKRPRGSKARLAKNCHQDGYTPLGSPRQHYSRLARIMYYPQDTPVELGPTHVIPGTQYHRALTDEDRKRAFPVAGRAGTVSLTHFDVGHAAGVSLLNQPRHMIKFIYVRASEPTAPSWNCRSERWRRPRNIESHYDLGVVWSHMWDWICGKRDHFESLGSGGRKSSGNGASRLVGKIRRDRPLTERLAAIGKLAKLRERAADAIPELLGMLNDDPQALRIVATYTLGAIGEPAIDPLIERLGAICSSEHGHPTPVPWSEGAVTMEDEAHALGAIGEPAVGALSDLLSSESEWCRINAAFALGEMDSFGEGSVKSLVKCLGDRSHRVVRSVLDALGTIRKNVAPQDIVPHLANGPGEWDEKLSRGWRARDQVRTNAALACARLGKGAAPAQEALVRSLDDPCGHVGSFAMQALERFESPSAQEAVRDYLVANRWDSAIREDRLF